MLCEGRLLSMMFSDFEELDSLPRQKALRSSHGPPRTAATLGPGSSRHSLTRYDSPEQTESMDDGSDSMELYIAPLQSLDLEKVPRQISSEIEIPAQAHSGGDVPFLVPPFCQSICENYSDLHIGGDQVLPLVANDGGLQLCTDAQPAGPFLQSCDVLPPVEDSPPGLVLQNGLLHPLRGGSNRTSARDQSFLFQGQEGPFSNSLLNHYLEQKLLDLYQQYMMENMAREDVSGSESDPGTLCNLLGSELVLTSLEHITLQLSREGNLEAGLAKDMVLSCLLRVAGDMHSSEISTPLLQISNEASKEQLSGKDEE